jgi:NADH:ubiquinone oxidoreductase subunit E
MLSDTENSVNLIKKFPEKTKLLEQYISTLEITKNIELNRGFLIQTLHKAQHIFGYLPEEVQLLVANKLGIHLTDVYAVISFYSFFTDQPVGKYKISVCLGTACFVKGSDKVMEELKRYLCIGDGESTKDMKYSLGILRCVGACSLAPVVNVNDAVYSNVTSKMVPEIIADCKD